MYPEPVHYGSNGLRKVKPFVEIYEHEIVFYAVPREIPFQSEECPYMHESIRTDLREFLNKLETGHAGIKYNAYNSMTKISKMLENFVYGTFDLTLKNAWFADEFYRQYLFLFARPFKS